MASPRWLAWILLLACGGCWKSYIRVDVVDAASGVSVPQVSASPAYRDKLRSIRTLAVRAPEDCPQDCGLRLEELERSLTAAGFRVISWDAMQGAAGRAVYERARQLGADAVLVVNDLEEPRTRIDQFTGLSLKFLQSNPEGDDLGAANVSHATGDALGAFVRQRYLGTDTSGLAAITAVVDATVVLAGSGEAIWFYRRSQTRTVAQEPATRFLFRGRENNHVPTFRLVAPRGSPLLATTPGSLASDPGGREATLLRDVTNDLAFRFRTGS